jgi:ribose/xylose/arabinose/galactoside ABC-type transport system permease subunit
MEKASFGQSLLLAVAVLMAGAAIGALNGLIVVLSRIPDVVATLTSGFIWGGVALVPVPILAFYILQGPALIVGLLSTLRGLDRSVAV